MIAAIGRSIAGIGRGIAGGRGGASASDVLWSWNIATGDEFVGVHTCPIAAAYTDENGDEQEAAIDDLRYHYIDGVRHALLEDEPTQVTGGGGVGVSPGTTGLLAWYDFADASDATGAFPLAESGTPFPTYTAGPPSYGTSGDGSGVAYWQQTSLDNAFAYTSGDWSMCLRFRTSSANSGDIVFTGNGSRTFIEYNTTGGTGLRLRCATGATVSTGVIPSLNTWYTVVLSFNVAAGQLSWSVNGSTLATFANVGSFAVGTMFFGAASTTNSNPFDFDFAGFWANKTLTQDNVDWLHNAGATRTYAEL